MKAGFFIVWPAQVPAFLSSLVCWQPSSGFVQTNDDIHVKTSGSFWSGTLRYRRTEVLNDAVLGLDVLARRSEGVACCSEGMLRLVDGLT
jgi:hypothetical protein